MTRRGSALYSPLPTLRGVASRITTTYPPRRCKTYTRSFTIRVIWPVSGPTASDRSRWMTRGTYHSIRPTPLVSTYSDCATHRRWQRGPPIGHDLTNEPSLAVQAAGRSRTRGSHEFHCVFRFDLSFTVEAPCCRDQRGVSFRSLGAGVVGAGTRQHGQHGQHGRPRRHPAALAEPARTRRARPLAPSRRWRRRWLPRRLGGDSSARRHSC